MYFPFLPFVPSFRHGEVKVGERKNGPKWQQSVVLNIGDETIFTTTTPITEPITIEQSVKRF